MKARLRAVALGGVLLCVGLAAAEATSRLDDWMHFGVPFLADPDRQHDLTVRDASGVHGRPNGVFKKWRLNQFGFRGPEISEEASPNQTRILLLGASETFGLYESEGKEFPAQLAERFEEEGRSDVEVVNAAMAGMTVKSMKPYWENWASRVHPRIVLIYPSPQLYLDDEPPAPPSDAQTVDALAPRSRFCGRIEDELRRSDLVRWMRVEYHIRTQSQGKGTDWLFHDAPKDRLDLFTADLTALTAAVRAHGAEPILITHAIKSASPPRPEDFNDLQSMRLFFPRALPEAMVAFEDAADQAIVELGRVQHVQVIDAARTMNGRREYFADLAHFNDAGAKAFADEVADELGPRLPPAPAAAPAGAP